MVKTRKKLIRELDKVFSKFIRLRDSNRLGYGKCITCGRIGHWKTMDCGHYIKRQHMTTRYDEKNCNMQCKRCNAFEQGANQVYKLKIDQKFGKGTSDWLELKQYAQSNLGRFELGVLLEHYKAEVQKMENEKCTQKNC